MSLPAQALLPNLKIKCLQWQQKESSIKAKDGFLDFKAKAHTYETPCLINSLRGRYNCEGDSKPVLMILTEEKGLFKSLSFSTQQLSPPGHAMSSIELQSGTLLAQTKEDVSLHSTRICPLTKGVTIFTERRRQGGEGGRGRENPNNFSILNEV